MDNIIDQLYSQRESIQDDLVCVLDGVEQQVINNACQVIVDHFQVLIKKVIDNVTI